MVQLACQLNVLHIDEIENYTGINRFYLFFCQPINSQLLVRRVRRLNRNPSMHQLNRRMQQSHRRSGLSSSLSRSKSRWRPGRFKFQRNIMLFSIHFTVGWIDYIVARLVA